jgi:MFS family permease
MNPHAPEPRSSSRIRARERLRLYVASAPRGKFWVYFTASIFFNIGFSIYFFLFNIYLMGFGLTERSLGLIGSFMAVGSILGTLPMGRLIDRIGLRWTLSLGVSLAVVVAILRVCVLWQPVQLGLALLSGFAMCSWAVCLSPAVASLTNERQRPFAFSVMFASGISLAGLGGLIAGHLPGYLRSAGITLGASEANRYTLLIGCVIAALALIPIAQMRLIRADAVPRIQPQLHNSFLTRFLIAMAAWGLVTGAFPPFANVFFVRHMNLSLERTGTVFSISQLVQFLAILCVPLLFRRVGISSGVMITQLSAAACLIGLALMESPLMAPWLYWAYMAVQCMNEPGIFSMLMERTPAHQRSGASAATFFVSSVSQAIASFAMGAAIVRFGYSCSFAVIAMLAILAAALFHRLARARVREPVWIADSQATTNQPG